MIWNLYDVLETIKGREKCKGCILEKRKPVILKPDRAVSSMVITESPKSRSINMLTSIANIQIFPYLYCLFSGDFNPLKDSNVYWTHMSKCPLEGMEVLERQKALEFCSDMYLKSEVETIKPKLVVAVGSSLSFFTKFDNRLKGEMKHVFMKQRNGIFKNVKVGSATFSLAVVPHPCDRNLFEGELKANIVETFKKIRGEIRETRYLAYFEN